MATALTYYRRLISSHPTIAEFLEFLEERQLIWKKKEILKEPPPWTQNPILQTSKFTNIYRVLDRQTQYELRNIPEDSLSISEQIFRIILFRHTISPRIYECLMSGGGETELVQLQEASTRLEYFVSDAIRFIPPKGYSRARWIIEYRDYVRANLDKIVELIQTGPSAKFVGEGLISILPRIGPFTGYELHNSLVLRTWYRFKSDDWLVCGPGAFPALHILLGVTNIQNAEGLIRELTSVIREELIRRDKFVWLPKEFQTRDYEEHQFDDHDLEMALCEFRKYKTIQTTGRIRRKYFGFPDTPKLL